MLDEAQLPFRFIDFLASGKLAERTIFTMLGLTGFSIDLVFDQERKHMYCRKLLYEIHNSFQSLVEE